MFRIKIPYPLQWGAPSFDAGHAFAMMAAVLVSLVEVMSLECNKLMDVRNVLKRRVFVNVFSPLELSRLLHGWLVPRLPHLMYLAVVLDGKALGSS